MNNAYRPRWQSYAELYDKGILEDEEIIAIDAMEDSITPLDDTTMEDKIEMTRKKTKAEG